MERLIKLIESRPPTMEHSEETKYESLKTALKVEEFIENYLKSYS